MLDHSQTFSICVSFCLFHLFSCVLLCLCICSLKDKDHSLLSHQATVSSMQSTQGTDPQWITNHFVLFLGNGWGRVERIKRIGGRSKSILSSAVLSLQALIRCCHCPLTDVFAWRSGPGSHASTTPPDTQPTQQQQNKQGNSTMPKPIISLSAIHSSIPPSMHPPILPSADWLTLLWSLFTNSQTDSCPPLFGRKVRLNSRLKSSEESNWLWPGFVTSWLHWRSVWCTTWVLC